MLLLAGKGDFKTCRAMAESVLNDGTAFTKCCQMFEAQGGDTSVLRDPSRFVKARYSRELTARADGYIIAHNVEDIGVASVLLGAGRQTKEDSINFAAGITLHKKLGDAVHSGQAIATLYADDPALFTAAEETFCRSLVIGPEKPQEPPLIYARVTPQGVERF